MGKITLDNPGQFNPGNDVTFTIHYTPDHNSQYCTLVVYGYRAVINGTTYEGGKFTKWANELVNGEGLVEITVPGGSLGVDSDNYEYASGKAQAYAVFGSAGEGEPGVIFNGHVNPDSNLNNMSNRIYLNMSIISNLDFSFEYTKPDGSYLATGSTFKIWMHMVYRHSFGQSNANNLKSYRIFLYDENDDIILDTGMLKDWLFPTYPNHSYRLKGLVDGATYYVSAQAVTCGGTTLTIPKTKLVVAYEPLPTESDRVELTRVSNGVKVKTNLIGIQYTKIVATRTAAYEGLSLVLKTSDYTGESFSFVDHYAIPQKKYVYKIVVYNGNEIVGTYSKVIDYANNYVVISDMFGSYAAIGDVKKDPISRNDRGAEIETMDSEFPYYLINGDANYERGTVDGIFGELDDCKLQTDNAIYSKQLRAWLNNGQPKLLTFYTGESWIVAVSGVQSTDPNNTDTLNTSFNWVQLGDGEDTDLYAEMGLIYKDGG